MEEALKRGWRVQSTHWPEANDDGTLHSWLEDGFPTNVHQETLEEDQKSLDRLVDKLRRPRA